MTVHDLIRHFIESEFQSFELFDGESGKTVFAGTIDECPENLQSTIVESIDNIGADWSDTLTINIFLEKN